MWTFIFVSVLIGVNISQSADTGMSTQMYYFKLKIEREAMNRTWDVLTSFKDGYSTAKWFKNTTICHNVTADTVECSCSTDYRWSDQVCDADSKCCQSKSCIFPKDSVHACVSESLVIVNGTVTLKEPEYFYCLAKEDTDDFKRCNKRVLREVKSIFNTLSGFDTIAIFNYRAGSTMADFKITYANGLESRDLKRASKSFTEKVKGKLSLETKGVVSIFMPPDLVPYGASAEVRCTVKENLGVEPEWTVKRLGEVSEITNGTVSTVTIESQETKVRLAHVFDQWAGEYTCAYHERSELYSISHQASQVMDICLKPPIYISVVPGFPKCENKNGVVDVTVSCAIPESEEQYNVSWTKENIPAKIDIKPKKTHEGTVTYEASTTIPCGIEQTPQVTCTFTNRCNRKEEAQINVNFIYGNESFCEAEGDWKDTKADFTAEIKCKDSYGIRKRACVSGSPKPMWKPEYSKCVNQRVNSVLEKSIVVDTGLGHLNENNARVFALLQNITNDTQAINTFANLNTSIYVLLTMSRKNISQTNETSTNDFLKSSSQMLNGSLNSSWITDNNNYNFSLAEIYLSSVENIINDVNITDTSTKEFLEVAIQNCTPESPCTNTVFNVTVQLKGSEHYGFVKSAGFKELEGYLPHNDTLKPNSIVVSTTTERKSSVQVKIKFPLLRQRRRNVPMRCVWWDNATGSWSTEGCSWEVENLNFNEGKCTCEHLSSFAVLVSKDPLKIPGINEITYVGLSISVFSLILSLVIELIVWSDVVKTNTLYLRHTTHMNISICLLVADCCFLASSQPEDISHIWCVTSVVLKHFCYLSMFFWMFSLSAVLLHQAVFLFHRVSKKHYLRFSLVLGYGCPFLIVAVTFLTNGGGAEDAYYSKETCWLVYISVVHGSIHTFLIPMGIIVFFNIFSMFVVIMKLLDHPKSIEKTHEKEKTAAMTILRSVILLTPIFGVTWVFGFAVMLLELTYGDIAYVVNYAFVLLNAFQGLFILLTTCLGDKLTREALLKHLKCKAPASTTDSTTKLDPTLKK